MLGQDIRSEQTITNVLFASIGLHYRSFFLSFEFLCLFCFQISYRRTIVSYNTNMSNGLKNGIENFATAAQFELWQYCNLHSLNDAMDAFSFAFDLFSCASILTNCHSNFTKVTETVRLISLATEFNLVFQIKYMLLTL